jgi:TonB-linked SusC/RagA family outer membrane protein
MKTQLCRWLCLAAASVALIGASEARAQATIAGRVVEVNSSRPLAGAIVSVEGTSATTTAAQDGRYRLVNVLPGRHTVVARLIGFAPARRVITVAADQQATQDFALQATALVLEEVLITGTAGGEQRRSVGNSVSRISAAEELSKSAAPNLSSLLNARAPGVVIAPSTSRLGAGPSILIRGRTSLSLDNSPLIYIDGVRVTNATATGPVGTGFGGQGATVAGRLNDIRPEDIERIEVIKGPAAGTIYGTEAANGVIQIITKKGAARAKPQYTLQTQIGTLEFANAASRVQTNYLKDASGNVVPWNGVQQEADSGRPIFKTGLTRLFNGTLSGAREQTNYYLSSSFENDLGVEPNNSLRQFSTHLNLATPVAQSTDLSTSLNFINLSAHLGADVGASALLGAEVGHRLLFPSARGFYPNWTPEIPQQLYDNASGINRFTGSTTLTNRPADWFTHRIIAGLDYTGDDSRSIEKFAPPAMAALLPASSAGGRIQQTLRHNSIATADYSGTAKFAVTPSVSSASSLGGQFYRTELNTSQLGGFGFPAPGVETVSAAATATPSTQTQVINTTIGAYAQEMVGWRERLFLTGAVRVDNNSAFGDKFKWVTYPKVSAAWVVSEEPFWRWTSAVNVLRLRGAYGESGRQPNAFAALRTYTPIQGPGGSTAVTPGSIGNADLRPEHGKEWELGLEATVLSRLDLDFTYFSKKTIDEIVNQPVAPSSGFSGNQFRNLGEVDNHGLELQATLRALDYGRIDALKVSRLSWDVTATVGTNHDVIKSLGGLPTLIPSAGQYNKVGYPIGAIFTRRVVSADRDPTTNLATNVMCDGGPGAAPLPCNTAAQIAAVPFVFIGTPTPKVIGAIGNTLNIGDGLRLYGLVDFKRGHRVSNNIEILRCTGLVSGAPGLCRANYYPLEYSPLYLAETPTTTSANGLTDQYYQDGSFLKLRELSASYTLPSRWVRYASSATVSFAGRDLKTWTKYRGPDPEINVNNPATSSSTADQAVTPPLRRFIMTLNLVF